jgi:hypothetical protein
MGVQPAERVSAELSRMSGIVEALESRLFRLMQERAEGAISFEDFAGKLAFLVGDLQECCTRAAELAERRDLNFETSRALENADARCLWLFRKIRQEQIEFWKLSLEKRLRALISEEAFALHQTLLNAEEEERDLMARDNTRLRHLLLGEGAAPPSAFPR